MRHAEKFGLPLLTFLDIPGADPGIASEERGQGTAIAECIQTLTELRVPIVATVIGEGGSGGALALGVADEVLMLENAIYAVASPDAGASILWKDAKQAPAAAAAMRITAADALEFGVIDRIVPEPVPAHEDPQGTIRAVGGRPPRSARSPDRPSPPATRATPMTCSTRATANSARSDAGARNRQRCSTTASAPTRPQTLRSRRPLLKPVMTT